MSQESTNGGVDVRLRDFIRVSCGKRGIGQTVRLTCQRPHNQPQPKGHTRVQSTTTQRKRVHNKLHAKGLHKRAPMLLEGENT